MAIEFDDAGLRVIGNNVKGIAFYDDNRVLRQTIYLKTDNTLNIGGAGGGGVTVETALTPHELSGSIHNGTLAPAQFPTALLTTGARSLTGQLTSTVATGTAPFVVASTTRVANLNADLWDGYEFADYLNQAVKTTSGPTFAGVTVPNGAVIGVSGGITLTFDNTGTEIETNATLRVDGGLDFVGAQSITTTTDNLTLAPAGDITINPTGNDVLPATNYDINLGALAKKYLTLHAAELWVETLVAQDTIATIGGRILVGPTTMLAADLGDGAGDTTITVKHNNLSSGDRVVMQANGKLEWMAITSGAGGGAGAYTYSVTRNLDGTGRNLWYAGDAVFNTGTTGDGFIDLYSVSGVTPGSTAGPTIAGNVRYGTTYNHYREAWAIGNLNGLYGYSTDVYGVGLGQYSAADYITIDPTNGVRFLDADDAVQAQLTGGVWTLGKVADNLANIQLASGAINFRGGTGGLQSYVSIDTSGGLVIESASGASYTWSQSRAVSFESSGNLVGGMLGFYGATTNTVKVLANTGGGRSGALFLDATTIDLETGTVNLFLRDQYVSIGGGLYVGGAGVNPGTVDIWGAGDGRLSGGLYVGSLATDPDADDIHYDGNLKSVKGGTAYDVYAFHPLTTPLTSTSWDGNDTISTGTWSWDTSTWGAPAGIKAALVQISGAWSSASAGNYAALRPKGGGTNVAKISALTTGQQDMTVVVPCDANGDIDIVVAGANMLNAVMRMWGYWI